MLTYIIYLIVRMATHTDDTFLSNRMVNDFLPGHNQLYLKDFQFLPSLEIKFLEKMESKEEIQESIYMGFQTEGFKDMWSTAEKDVDFMASISL